MDLDRLVDLNMRRAGEIFINCLWTQGQMIDLMILKQHPKIVKLFLNRIEKVPYTLAKERVKLWRKDFGEIQQEFEKVFAKQLTQECRKNIRVIYHLRNAISHSSISYGRSYFLYKPNGRTNKVNRIIRELDIKARPDSFRPRILKLDFTDDKRYLNIFAIIKNLDEVQFRNFAEYIKIPHSRIR